MAWRDTASSYMHSIYAMEVYGLEQLILLYSPVMVLQFIVMHIFAFTVWKTCAVVRTFPPADVPPEKASSLLASDNSPSGSPVFSPQSSTDTAERRTLREGLAEKG